MHSHRNGCIWTLIRMFLTLSSTVARFFVYQYEFTLFDQNISFCKYQSVHFLTNSTIPFTSCISMQKKGMECRKRENIPSNLIKNIDNPLAHLCDIFAQNAN